MTNPENNIQHLILSYERRLHLLKKHKALQGWSTPPETQLEIKEIEAEIKNLKIELEAWVNKTPQASSTKKAILIVDDQPNWRKLFVELLEDEYTTITASNYPQALETLLLQKPPFHLVIADLRLNDEDDSNEDGLRLIDMCNRMGKYTKAILVTGYPSIETVKRAFKDLDVVEYIDKGQAINPTEFRQLVRDTVNTVEKSRLT